MRRTLTLLALAVLAAAAPGAARAQEAAAKPPGETKLTLGGVWVLQFRVAAGGFSPEQRLERLQERVVQVLSREELRPEHVRVVPGRGGRSATITVGPVLFVTVTEADAAASRSTPVKLAEVWAENFRKGFAASRPKPIRPQ
jgi:hypothetical protein